MKNFDVYSYGVISASALYLLKSEFPARGGYAEIVKKYMTVGGEAANTSIVLSRLGLSVRLDGNWINPDEDGDYLKQVFSENNVDISRLSFRSCQGPKEMLVVDSDSRTIFGTYSQLLEEKSWNLPEKIDVQNADVVCLDPFFDEASLLAADYAKALSKPIVTVDCKYDDPIFMASDIAIISEEYVGQTYRHLSISSVTEDYRANSSGTVIFTFGHKEILFGSGNEGFKTFTPYQIDPVDTAGAGDSFRAGIIFGLLNKWPVGKSIEFASALAATVCLTYPGVLNAPTYDEVMSFLKEHESGRR